VNDSSDSDEDDLRQKVSRLGFADPVVQGPGRSRARVPTPSHRLLLRGSGVRRVAGGISDREARSRKQGRSISMSRAVEWRSVAAGNLTMGEEYATRPHSCTWVSAPERKLNHGIGYACNW